MAFKLYDRDKDGYITKAEMIKISKTLTKEQVEKVKIQHKVYSYGVKVHIQLGHLNLNGLVYSVN